MALTSKTKCIETGETDESSLSSLDFAHTGLVDIYLDYDDIDHYLMNDQYL